jgi:hypothetical protein
MVVAAEAASMAAEVDSAVADTPAAVRARAMAVARVLELPEPIGAELAGVPMERTEDLVELTERDPAPTAAGHTAVRPTARDTLARMVAGPRRGQQVHATVQRLTAAQTQRQPREITALPVLALTAARAQGTLRRQPTEETLRCQRPALRAARLPPIDQDLR